MSSSSTGTVAGLSSFLFWHTSFSPGDVDNHPRILSLCAGIGGLDLGIQLALPRARTICFVEREAAACQILASRMEEGRLAPAPVWTDIKTFDGTAWRGCVDLIAAGYPCTPFSVAGKRRGEKDPRHLWPEVRRILGEVRPRYIFLENVPGHLRLGFDRVLGDLTELGFDAEWGVYSASQVGAPHRRNRVFVLAYRRGERLEGLQRSQSAGTRGGSSHSGEEVGNPDSKGLQRWCGSEREGLHECPTWPPGPEGDWEDVPEHLRPAVRRELCDRVDGVSVWMDQIRALGNAVCPQQASYALRDLIKRVMDD
jgi:DNA (cytosine-5)-methyltransferase 1